VEPLANDLSIGVHDDGTNPWVGVTEKPSRCELERTSHQGGVELVLWRGDFTVDHVLPLLLGSNFGRAPGRER
jgi:hypothetical protein